MYVGTYYTYYFFFCRGVPTKNQQRNSGPQQQQPVAHNEGRPQRRGGGEHRERDVLPGLVLGGVPQVPGRRRLRATGAQDRGGPRQRHPGLARLRLPREDLRGKPLHHQRREGLTASSM